VVAQEFGSADLLAYRNDEEGVDYYGVKRRLLFRLEAYERFPDRRGVHKILSQVEALSL